MLLLLGIINISFLAPKGKIIKKRCKNKNLAYKKKIAKLVFSVAPLFLCEIGAKLSAGKVERM